MSTYGSYETYLSDKSLQLSRTVNYDWGSKRCIEFYNEFHDDYAAIRPATWYLTRAELTNNPGNSNIASKPMYVPVSKTSGFALDYWYPNSVVSSSTYAVTYISNGGSLVGFDTWRPFP